jgi:uncharacterized protein YqhQ
MQMLIFILYTIFFIIGSIGVFKFLLYATSENGFLSHWQKVLDWLWSRNRNAAKLLGACGMCFAHFCSIVSFAIYVAMLWDIWIWNLWQSIIWYFLFVGFTWMGMFKQLPKESKP